MIENKFERWSDIDDPNRCKAGDCPYKAVPNTDFCPRHNASSQLNVQAKIQLRNFNLNKIWGDEINRLNLSPHAKSLLEEISLARLVIQNIVNMCTDQYDLAMHSTKIMEMLAKLKDLQVAYTRIEREMTKHLDRDEVQRLVTSIVEVVVKYVEDPDVREKIAEEIDASFSRAVQNTANSGTTP